MNGIKQESFQELLHHSIVFELLRENILHDYAACAPGKELEVQDLFSQVFALLDKNKGQANRLRETLNYIRQKVLFKQDPDFWFNQIYQNYKRNSKPQKRYHAIKDDIQGTKILDIGCGNGLLSLQCHQDGYDVFMTDILDWRDESAKSLTFKSMEAPTAIPYPDQVADTALIFAVIHHIDAQHQAQVLKELHRLSTRIIIEEDCYAIPDDRPEVQEVLKQDRQLQKFHQLSHEDQFRYLMLIDYFANAITIGIPEMNFPFEFKKVEEWEDIFREADFSVRKTLVKGFQKGNFNRSCHVWYVIDRERSMS